MTLVVKDHAFLSNLYHLQITAYGLTFSEDSVVDYYETRLSLIII